MNPTNKDFIRAIQEKKLRAIEIFTRMNVFSEKDFTEAFALSSYSGFDAAVRHFLRISSNEEWRFLRKSYPRVVSLAAYSDRTGIIKTMELFGIDSSLDESFPLSMASSRGKKRSSVFLSINPSDKNGALNVLKKSFAKGEKKLSIECANIIGMGSEWKSILKLGIQTDSPEIIEALYMKGFNLSEKMDDALFSAIETGKISAIKKMTSLGCDILARGEKELLSVAKKSGSIETIKAVHEIMTLKKKTIESAKSNLNDNRRLIIIPGKI